MSKLKSEQARWATGHSPAVNRLKVEDLVDRWMAGKSDLTARTVYTYHRELEWVLGSLGKIRIADTTPQTVHEVLLDMARAGQSYRARTRALAHLRSIFELGVDLELLPRNPARNVRINHGRDQQARAHRALSKDEVTRLLSVVDGTALETQVLLLLSLGLRRGELLARPIHEWGAVRKIVVS